MIDHVHLFLVSLIRAVVLIASGGLLGGQETLSRVDAYDPVNNKWINKSKVLLPIYSE